MLKTVFADQPVIPKSTTGLQQILISVFGNLFATGLSAVAIIIISRLLGPNSFGQFSVAVALSVVITKVNDFGLSSALHRYVGSSITHQEKNRYISGALKSRILISTMLFSVCIIFSEQIARYLKLENQNLIFLSIIFGCIISYYDHLLAVLQSIHSFTAAVIANTIQAGTKLAGALIFLTLNLSDIASNYLLYIGAPVSSLIASPLLFPKWISHTQRWSKNQKNHFLHMATHASVVSISNNIVDHVSILLTQMLITSFESGILSGVYRIAMIFSLAALSLGNVLYPRVARYNNPTTLAIYIKKAFSISGLLLLSIPLALLVSKPALTLTVGSAYLSGLPVLKLLLTATLIQAATVPFAAIFYATKSNWYFSASGVILLLFIVVGHVVLLPTYGLLGAGWANLFSRVAVAGLTGIALFYQFNRHATK